jgi:hypothetical protein
LLALKYTIIICYVIGFGNHLSEKSFMAAAIRIIIVGRNSPQFARWVDGQARGKKRYPPDSRQGVRTIGRIEEPP